MLKKFHRWAHRAAYLALSTLLMAGASKFANASDDTSTGSPLDCVGKTQGSEMINFSCPLVAGETPQRYSLKAHFLGSHDDTELSMTPTINGEAVVCDEGALTTSLYEDGDITLNCKFGVAGLAETQRVLMVSLRFYHAQLDTVDFVSE